MVDAQGLTVEWVDHRGKTWNLSTGEQGVLLATGQDDFHLSSVDHTWWRGDSQWGGVRYKRAEPSLKVFVGLGLEDWHYYELADEWWSQANSPLREGTLRVTRPDGIVRELRARLRDTPGTQWEYDPGRGLVDQPAEAWLLAGSSPFWSGEEQYVRLKGSDLYGSGTPFYGPSGAAWPLYIGSSTAFGDAYISNTGQGPLWLTWTLHGPMTGASFGVSDGVLTYSGSLSASETVVVTTEPGDRRAFEVNTGDSRYGNLTGSYAAVPPGMRVNLVMDASGMTKDSYIEVSSREQFVRPF